jgi:hypothetical protein
LFFSDLGRRLLPSGSGRTTACVTELRFDRDVKTGIKLLPIETRENARSFQELYRDDTSWRSILFDADNADSVGRALAALSETKRITLTDAVAWGLHGGGIATPANAGGMAMVDVPRWRYAIINLPHPLLDAGLVVIDTPGLSALTAEPELSRDRMPGADALVLVLDITEGVTKADLAIWKDYLGGARNQREREKDDSRQARLVVLNKIDRLRAHQVTGGADANREMLREIDSSVQVTADLLRVDPIQVIPVSAQMALTGKFTDDKDKLIRSRLYQLERAIADKLPRGRQTSLTREIVEALASILESAQSALDQERFNTLEGLQALNELRAKNEKMTLSLMEQTAERNKRLDAAIKELKALKAVHARLGEEIAAIIDLDTIRSEAKNTRDKIASVLLHGANLPQVQEYLEATRARLDAVEAKIDEVRALYGTIGEKMSRELGFRHFEVHPFATQRFRTELQKAEQKAATELTKSGNLLIRRGHALSTQFMELVAGRIVHVFEIASRESTSWMRGLYAALEKPIEELLQQTQVRNTNIEKVKGARLDLADQVAELQARIDVIKRRHAALADARSSLERFTARDEDAS